MTRRTFAQVGTSALLVAVLLAAVAPPPTAASAGGNGGDAPDRAATATPTGTPAGATLVVDGDDDGDDEYATVGAALDAAAAGDTVAVESGTYAASVTVEESVTVVARGDVTLDGSSLAADAVAFEIDGDAAPTIAGFTVTGYAFAVDARETTGDWTLRDVTVRGLRRPAMNRSAALSAVAAEGDWRVIDSTFVDNDVAVDARRTAGEWTVSNATFRDNDFGVKADHSTGDWTVAGSYFSGHRDGVSAWYAEGEWVVRTSTFERNREGVYTSHGSGNWVVANSSFRSNRFDGVDASANSGDWRVLDSTFLNNTVGVTATGTGGHWALHGNAFAGSERSAVYALGAEHEGDATRNWWGNARGQDRDDCYGDVRCDDHLTEPPVDDPAFVGRTDTETWNSTPVETLVAGNETAAETEGGGGDPAIGRVAGAALLVLITVGGVLGPLLYVRRYGLQ